MAPPELSIVIPTHQRSDLLALCLQSVCRYAPPRTEILVIDDGSPDAAGSAVARAAGVHYLRLSRRQDFCAAANAGIRSARGGVIELLNDDTEVTPGWADAPLAAFGDSAVAAVAPLVVMRTGTNVKRRIDSAGDRYYRGGIAGKRGHAKDLNAFDLRRRRVFGASACAAFYRRDALLEVGGFPPSFGAYFEDIDLAFRLHRAGYEILFEPTSQVFHRVSASHAAPNRHLLQQQSSNEERVFWRNLPGSALRRALPLHAAVLAAKTWRRWNEGTMVPFVCGRLRVLREIPAILAHRRGLLEQYGAPDMTSWLVDQCYSDVM